MDRDSTPVFVSIPSNPKFLDLRNKRFGRVLVEGYLGKRGKASLWFCRCDCGQTRHVPTGTLRSGYKSCGCIKREYWAARHRTHGKTDSREFRNWQGMIDRCFNANSSDWNEYGGRGITVCERWLGQNGFANFLLDMGTRPSIQHSIDRFPNRDGNYEPGNCRWATKKEQSQNRKNVIWITIAGTRLCVADWALQRGIKPGTIRKRLRLGWSADDAVLIPVT